MRDIDTIIVGGGPAGSSCARELIQNGRECVILDRKTFPRLKLCGGWVTPKVFADLQCRVEDYPHGIVALNTIKAYLGRARRFSVTLHSDQYSIRRVEFDDWLITRSGAEVIQHAVQRIERSDESYILDNLYRCRNLVGAGGTNCPVKKSFFDAEHGRRVIAQEVEYETSPQTPTCTLWFPYAGTFGYAWYVPKANAINIGYGGLKSQLKNQDRRQLWQVFVELLKSSGCIHETPPEPKGYSYFLGDRRKQVRKENAYLVGDAAGLATLDLAEGIGPAVESGLFAARTILGHFQYSAKSITKYSLPCFTRLLRKCATRIPYL